MFSFESESDSVEFEEKKITKPKKRRELWLLARTCRYRYLRAAKADHFRERVALPTIARDLLKGSLVNLAANESRRGNFLGNIARLFLGYIASSGLSMIGITIRRANFVIDLYSVYNNARRASENERLS